MMEMPPLPQYPVLPASEDRGKWNAWAREYGELCARMAREQERERCALICEEVGLDIVEAAVRRGSSLDGRTVQAVAQVCADEIRSAVTSPEVIAAIRAG